jgi:hypothetical protein
MSKKDVIDFPLQAIYSDDLLDAHTPSNSNTNPEQGR